MRNPKTMLASAVLALTGLLGLGLAAAPASATTGTCTAHAGALTPPSPIGCGGLQLLYAGHGDLGISAAGNFSNAKVVMAAEASNSSQDFTVFQLPDFHTGSPFAGEGNLGEFVAMFTPLGQIPGNPHNDFDPSSALGHKSMQFCISVQNQLVRVRGHLVQRWKGVLRNCWSHDTTFFGPSGAVPGGVSHPNPYQVWEPIVGDGGLSFVNKALLSRSLRHGLGGNGNYVLDDSGFGGPGTQVIAFLQKSGGTTSQNQEWRVRGCTDPGASLNGGADTDCP